jgi:hypothetical protein
MGDPMTPIGIAGLVVGVGVGGYLAFYWLLILASGARSKLALRREHVRADRSYYAAIEAAEEDPDFAPEAVKQTILQIVTMADGIWRARTGTVSDARADGPLIAAWARARQSRLGSGLRVRGNPSVELIRVVNRPGESEDRVVARVGIRVHRRRSRLDVLAVRHVRLDERWTLGRYEGRWVLLSVEGSPLEGPILTAPLIPTPAYDTERLQEESLAELATAQKIPATVSPSELVDADAPPAFALLDLSVVDGRYLPVLVAAQLARLVEAWEEAVTGSPAPLAALTSDAALAALLRPAPGKRLIIRDAVLKSWEPIRLELASQPPMIVVMAEIEAIRYVVTDDGAHRAGNDNEPRQIVLIWTLELTDDTRTPWRLLSTTNPAQGIPGWSLF